MSDGEKHASQIAGLIPQVFYDLIGRIIPGAFLLVLGFLLVRKVNFGCTISKLLSETEIPYSLFLLVGLLFSYMTGILLGGIGYFIEDILRKVIFVIFCKDKKSSKREKSIIHISYWYDAIQHYEPAAGARLAKLSAEMNMCRVLIVGFVILIIVSLPQRNEICFIDWLRFILFSAISSILFYIHLIGRSRKLIKNYRCIIKQEDKSKKDSITCESSEGDEKGVAEQNENKKS